MQATNTTADSQSPSAEPTGHKVFAGNLTYAVTDDGLKVFFAPVAGDIISAQVITRGTRSAGYGFVTLKTLEAAQKACQLLDKTELEGRQVVIEIAKPADQKDKERTERRKERRAGRARGRAPPGEVTEAEANGDSPDKATEADPSAVIEGTSSLEEGKRKGNKKKRVSRKKTKKTSESADATTENDKTAVDSVAPDSDKAAAARKKTPRPPREKRAPRPAGEDPSGEPSTTVLFVANLGFNIDDSGLSELFTVAGINVISARVVRRRWGKPRKSKGYGFVDVGGEEEQKKAIAALQGKEVEGREIAVKVAVNANHEDEQGVNGVSHAKESSPEATIVAQ